MAMFLSGFMTKKGNIQILQLLYDWSQDGYNRIIRGVSWCNEADQLRSADRASEMRGISATFIGFRLAFKKVSLI